ncbi:hypothetical protein [Microbacterium amylolyticum]|uniref:Uncharacterized protein n=1 Tax=Microbacterium amylolyticum TaxID=936337 RepID=A0ABS4ZHJ5_9MICO|nr:hypothetical protein [Microbacterium amylolyticum]MBP2436745.1 hypothetical protein [Microbacterium amylolyticum]
MGEAWLIVAALMCASGIAVVIMRLGRMKNGGGDDDDAFGPRRPPEK